MIRRILKHKTDELSGGAGLELLTPLELATTLRLSKQTVQRYREQNLIPFIKLSDHTIRFRLGDVLEALAKCEVRKVGSR